MKGDKRMRKAASNELLDETVMVRGSRPSVRRRVSIDCSSPVVTKQDFKESSDVNNILKGYMKTGVLSWVNPKTGIYADCSNIGDYQRCLAVVEEARASFMRLPPQVRIKFANDPGGLLVFLSDPRNRSEAMEMGLLEPDEAFKRKKAGLPEKAVSDDSKAVSVDSGTHQAKSA